MALPATDGFNSGSALRLTVYSANWTTPSVDSWWSYTDRLSYIGGGVERGAHWAADSFQADQYALATKGGTPAANACIGPAVRASNDGTETYYGYYADSDNQYLVRIVGGGYTDLGYHSGGWAALTWLRLEVDGDTLTPSNSGQAVPPSAQTDSGLDAGFAGVAAWGTNSNGGLDTWEGGNLYGSSPVTGSLTLTLAGATLSATGSAATGGPLLAAGKLGSSIHLEWS